MNHPRKKAREGYKLIFPRFIRKKGKIIYPKNGQCFCFEVKL